MPEFHALMEVNVVGPAGQVQVRSAATGGTPEIGGAA